MFSFCCKNKHKLLTLISFSLLYSVAASLGFHSRSVPLSFFLRTTLFIFLPALLWSWFQILCVMDFPPSSFLHLSYWIVQGEKKKTLLSRPAQQVTHECAHCFPPPPLSISLPGSQIYHSAVCVLVQFLMLRLMGRTVTTVLSSFIFQMVRCLVLSPSLSPRQGEDVFCPLLFFFCSDVLVLARV